MLAIIFFLYKLFKLIRKGPTLFMINNKNLKATSIMCFVYFITLFSIDIGGLFFQILLSYIFYLHEFYKIKLIGVKK
jgi:hypothetical protein